MRYKDIRTSRKLTQQQVADLLGIPLRTYQNYERGINEPDTDMLCKSADNLGVTVDYLVGFSDVMISSDRANITHIEKRLLDAYRQLDDTDRATVTRVVYALLDTAEHGGM